MKTVGKITETIVLKDLNVEKNFFMNTALNCFPKEKEHTTLGSTKLSISGTFPVPYSL